MVIRTGEFSNYRTNYKTEEYYVAYLDFLGTKSFIEKDKDNKYLNDINLIYEDSISYLKFDKHKPFIKIFSDNILLAEKVCDDTETNIENIKNLFSLCATIQNIALKEGYLIRGAITKGVFFHNEIFVYGKALVEAEQMEREVAIYPRIIAKKEIVNMDEVHFILDSDGCYYLNNFIYTCVIGYGGLINYKIKILENLKINKDNEKIKQKIMWLINRYNYITNYSWFRTYPKIKSEEISDALK